jgi:hypothetical protein
MFAASVIRVMMVEVGNTSETSVNFYITAQHNNSEDSHLDTWCHENQKSYISSVV